MKRIFTLLCILCIIAQAYAWKPLFAGHRGSYRGVENTEEAMLNAINYYGYTGIETDIKTTKDGHCVCWHDDDLKRVGHEGVTIAGSTLAELQALTLTQTRSGNTYTATICTADRYLEICKENNAFPIIELKWADGINNNDMSRFPTLYQLIEKHGLVEEAIILTSMKKSLEYVRSNYPALQCHYLCYEVTEERYDWCVEWNIRPSVQKHGLSNEMARRCHDAGLDAVCWTINNETDYLKHGALGCPVMTCDYLMPSEMPELDSIDWDLVVPPPPSIPVEAVEISPTEVTVVVKDTAKMQVTIIPDSAINQDVAWRMTPTSRTAKLRANGHTATLTSSKAGTFTVTATAEECRAECVVTFTHSTDLDEGTIVIEPIKKLQDNQLIIQHNNNHYTVLGTKL